MINTKFKIGDTVSIKDLALTHGIYYIISNSRLDKENTFTIGTLEYYSDTKDEKFRDIYNKCIEKYGRKPLVFINPYEEGVETWEHF